MTCVHGWNWRKYDTCPKCESANEVRRHLVHGRDWNRQSVPDNLEPYQQGRTDGLRRGRLVGMLIGVTLMTLVYFVATWRP